MGNEQPTLDQLGKLERTWLRADADLAGWRRDLTNRAGDFEGRLEELEGEKAVWSLTLEKVRGDTAPPEILEAIQRSLSEIEETRGKIAKQLSEVLALQNRVSRQEVVVTESLEAIEAARASVRSRLLELASRKRR